MPYEHVLALVDSDDSAALMDALERCYDLGATQTAGWIVDACANTGSPALPGDHDHRRARTRPVSLPGRSTCCARWRQVSPNAQIAEQLYISEKTAGHQVSAILTKLGVSSRRDAARLAVDLGVAG